jgi:hypothetical protein
MSTGSSRGACITQARSGTTREEMVGVGPGFIDEHHYQAKGTGRIYDTREPPPGPCWTYGSPEHYRRTCPRASGNEIIRHLFP